MRSDINFVHPLLSLLILQQSRKVFQPFHLLYNPRMQPRKDDPHSLCIQMLRQKCNLRYRLHIDDLRISKTENKWRISLVTTEVINRFVYLFQMVVKVHV
jgi:hypothetical protein